MKSLVKIVSLSALLAGTSVALFTGCAATSTKESTGEYVDDVTITGRVKAAFVKDEIVKAREISVETFKGVVQLSGFVNTSDEKARAGYLAAGIKGATSVQNKITVK